MNTQNLRTTIEALETRKFLSAPDPAPVTDLLDSPEFGAEFPVTAGSVDPDLNRIRRDLDQVEQNLRRIRQSLSRMQQGMLSGTKSGDGSFQFSRVPVTDGTAEAHAELYFG